MIWLEFKEQSKISKHHQQSVHLSSSRKKYFLTFPVLIIFLDLPGRNSDRTMRERKILSVILLTSLTFLLMAKVTFSCNQMLCASIVSKCMLTQSCKCDLKNCTCCKDCYQCLSWLWQECCSCVGKHREIIMVFKGDPNIYRSRFMSEAKRHQKSTLETVALRWAWRHSRIIQCSVRRWRREVVRVYIPSWLRRFTLRSSEYKRFTILIAYV